MSCTRRFILIFFGGDFGPVIVVWHTCVLEGSRQQSLKVEGYSYKSPFEVASLQSM